jgi:pyruvate,orthophosphate dikinase
MLETVLNVGMTEDTVNGLVWRTGNPWLAWDTYRRFLRSFGDVVLAVPLASLNEIEQRALEATHVERLDELDPLVIREIARAHARLLASRAGGTWVRDPFEQVLLAIDGVLRSWETPRARAYRRFNGLSDRTGSGVLIQTMVLGNAGPLSGSGVGFTRNPGTGADEFYIDFIFNGQGEDLVSGRDGASETLLLRDVLPGPFRELQAARSVLEGGFHDMQDFEFTIEDGELYFLQARSGTRTPWAALQIAVDLVNAGTIDRATALKRLEGLDIEDVHRTLARPGPAALRLCGGVGASPGSATGALCLSTERARAVSGTTPVILARHDLTTDDLAGLSVAAGLLTVAGGRTAHAAVVARQLDTPAVVGCGNLLIEEGQARCRCGPLTVHEGDTVTIDGSAGVVYAGIVPSVTERPTGLLEVVKRWRAAV